MKDMTFSLPEGCILGLVGKNGAGKSTTIHLIMDMIHKDSGTIYVLGKNIEEDFTETKQDIGVVLELAGSTAPKQRNPFGESGKLCPKSERHPDDLSGRRSLQFVQ